MQGTNDHHKGQLSAWGRRLVGKAQTKTGLVDCGPPSYLRFLAHSLRDVRENGALTLRGRFLYGQNIVRCTATRLKLVALAERHPEIRDIEIAAPVVVTGLYRSGTTLLHRLLSASSGLAAPLFWQLTEVGSDASPKKKLEVAKWSRRAHRLLSPGFEDAHEILADDVEECFHLFEYCAPTTPYWMTAAQEHAWWMLAPEQQEDMVAAYEFYKLQLQVLAWRHGDPSKSGQGWALKWPYHLWHLDALRTVFPDVRVIVCRRDATEAGFEKTVASICSLASHGLYPFTGKLDKRRHGRFWWEHCKAGVERFRQQRSAFESNLTEVSFEELCAQPDSVAGALASWLGIERPPASIAPELERRRRQHRYSAAEFGLPP